MKRIYSFVFLSLFFFTLDLSAKEEWNRLYVSSSTATSFLRSNWNKYEENYHPNYAFDDDPQTAWVEGKEGYGNGETISWRISSLGSTDSVKLRIKNGYHKSDALLESNSAPKTIKVSVWNEQNELVTSREFELKKIKEWQEVILPIPDKKGIQSMSLTILNVIPGKVYKDTCISDIQTFVQSDVIYQKRIEEKKKQELTKWIQKRVKTANYFAELPSEFPYSSTKFDTVYKDGKNTDMEKELSEKDKILSEIQSNSIYYKILNSVESFEIPDGLEGFYYFPFLNPNQISIFELNAPIQKTKVETLDSSVEIFRSNYKILWNSPEKKIPSEIYFNQETHEEGRNVYISHLKTLLSYRNGKLVSIFGKGTGISANSKEETKFNNIEYTKLHYDSKGKIFKIEKYFKTPKYASTRIDTAVPLE